MTEYAYPQSKQAGSVSATEGGMELRDYFAGQALVATLIAMSNGQHTCRPGKGVMETAALDSYEMADAMIEQRKATK